VIVRPIASYGMPQHLRVTVGLESENARFLAALARSLVS
jgi:histidinol-phosphate aminotransferase